MTTAPRALAAELLAILERDLPTLRRVDDYLNGRHDDPYMPARADAEYRLLARRAITNMSLILVGTPAQALYVDNYRRGGTDRVADDTVLPEWLHWQESRLDARQTAVHRAALAYGHSFVLTERQAGRVRSKGLSPLRTVAVYDDPANDDAPVAAITVTQWPKPGDKGSRGSARMWDGRREYTITFRSLTDATSVGITGKRVHGSSECPVTRFASCVDLEGRTLGVIEPMIALQNRINQTVFDLLVAQTYGSFTVRTATGMAPPLKTRPVHQRGQEPYTYPDEPAVAGVDSLGRAVDRDGWVLDDNGQRVILDTAPVVDPVTGQHVYEQVDISARRFLFAKDPQSKWGSLDATPLGGFIDSLDMSFRPFSALAQVPPHHLLGQIANLSAEALQAAETALARKVEEFRKLFGESWERVFRLAAELSGDLSLAQNYLGEVIWRDMEMKSLGAVADGLGKMAEQLGIPRRGLWPRVPNVTRQELEDWARILKEDSPEDRMADALIRATPGGDAPAPGEE